MSQKFLNSLTRPVDLRLVLLPHVRREHDKRTPVLKNDQQRAI